MAMVVKLSGLRLFSLEKIIYGNGRKPQRGHQKIQSAVPCQRNKRPEQIRPDADSEIQKNIKRSCRQSEPVGGNPFEGYGLGAGHEVSIAHPNNRPGDQQNRSASGLTEQKHTGREKKEAGIDDEIGAPEVKQA